MASSRKPEGIEVMDSDGTPVVLSTSLVRNNSHICVRISRFVNGRWWSQHVHLNRSLSSRHMNDCADHIALMPVGA